MQISLIKKDTSEVVFENIKGFRVGISVIVIFDEKNREHMFDLSDFQAIYINHLRTDL